MGSSRHDQKRATDPRIPSELVVRFRVHGKIIDKVVAPLQAGFLPVGVIRETERRRRLISSSSVALQQPVQVRSHSYCLMPGYTSKSLHGCTPKIVP